MRKIYLKFLENGREVDVVYGDATRFKFEINQEETLEQSVVCQKMKRAVDNTNAHHVLQSMCEGTLEKNLSLISEDPTRKNLNSKIILILQHCVWGILDVTEDRKML